MHDGTIDAVALRRGRAPPRPLFQLALALALGSAWGAYFAPHRIELCLVASAVAAAWLAWRMARADAGDPAHAPASRLGIGVLAMAVLLAAVRASPEAGVRWDTDLAAWDGTWRPRREADGEVRGTLAPVGSASSVFELPRGCVLEGERIRVLRGSPPAPPPRGPFTRPGNSRGAPEVVVAEADEVLRLATPDEGARWGQRWRALLDQRAATLADPAAAALARAFLLGDSSALDAASVDLFKRNGLLHVLAVSGWHVAMMAWMIVRPFAALAEILGARYPRRQRLLAWTTLIASIALCIAYVPLTGGGAPVRRSAIAVALASTAAFWPQLERTSRGPILGGARIDALSLWSAALCAECWLDPAALGEIAVQLSYAATFGLIVATRPLSARLAAAIGLELRPTARELLHSWPRQCAAALGRRVLRASLSGVAASIAAVAATAPIVWLSFGEACAWGVVSTPLLAPLFMTLFASGMLMLAAPLSWFGDVFSAASRALFWALDAIDRFPGTPTLLPDRPGWLLVGTLLAGWALLRSRIPGARALDALRAGTALGAAGILLPWAPAPAGFELHVLEVGHGTCAVFRAPGEPCWIFDCGSRDRSRVAQQALAPLLRAWEIAHPVIVLSHSDRDHAGGLRWVLERAPPRAWAGAAAAPWAERIPHTSPRVDLEAGRMRLSEQAPGLELWLLRGAALEGNEGSRSLLIRFEDQAVLLCGDAEGEGLACLLREGLLEATGGLLLAPHHGSDGRYVGALLDAFEPGEVWISGSGPPPIGAELRRRRLPTRCTATDGPLTWRPP